MAKKDWETHPWRIILHWTAGAPGISPIEADSYHFIVDREGCVHTGKDAVEDNIPPLRAGRYAAHTLNANSRAIGVALDAMAGATERPFNPGPYPITEIQVEAMVQWVAALCKKYGIPVQRDRVLTHAEVQGTLGIAQRNKWDIMWLPGMRAAAAPLAVGDVLRDRIKEAMK